jgi:hypothetical protein
MARIHEERPTELRSLSGMIRCKVMGIPESLKRALPSLLSGTPPPNPLLDLMGYWPNTLARQQLSFFTTSLPN